MKRILRYFARAVAAFLVTASVVATGACSFSQSTAKSSAPEPSGPVAVVSSLKQWGSLVQEIGGDQVKVTSIMNDASQDAQNFEPSSSDVTAIANAGLLVINGAGYDSWASKNVGKDAVLISAADTVGASEGDNPYLWFSKEARNSMATEITESLSKLLPAKKTYFHNRLSSWQSTETTLENSIKAFAKTHKDLTYTATMPVTYYLMADLGFKDATPENYLRSIQSSGEATAQDMKDFITVLEKKRTDLLVVDSQHTTDSAKTLITHAQTANIPILSVSAQMPDQHSTLVQWVESLVTQISNSTAKSNVSAPPSPNASIVPNESGSQSQ
jgi:zinc/manganese transport system substrate-binding protein